MARYDIAPAWFQTPRGRACLMFIRDGTSDWNTAYSALNEDEYGLAALPDIATAVDVGGHIGSVGIGLALDHPEARVLIVEPVPDNVDLIRASAETNRVADRVTVLAGAAGDGSEVTVAYGYRGSELALHHAFIGNSSFAYDNPGGEKRHRKVHYRSLAIADVIGDIGTPDLLKIDTEGAEWAFLASGAERLPLIVGEWHAVRGHAQADMAALLGTTHDVTFTGPVAGPGGFRAVRRG